LLVGWSWANQGISLCWSFYLGAYELIELDIYAYVACYEMIEWINWLIIKCGLIHVGWVHKMTFSKWIEWIYVLWKYSNKLISSLIHIWWSMLKWLKSVLYYKIWVSYDLSHIWVTKSTYIGLKFGMHALDIWYNILYEFHENWIRDASVFKLIFSAIVQQFLACSSGGRFEIW